MPRKKSEPPQETLPAPPTDSAGAVAWAQAILYAAENLGKARVTQRQAGSKINYAMWQASREYPKEFLVQLMPKALAILDKNKAGVEEEEIEKAEEKSIKELEGLLAEYRKDAGGQAA